jgi:hypothetical protein
MRIRHGGNGLEGPRTRTMIWVGCSVIFFRFLTDLVGSVQRLESSHRREGSRTLMCIPERIGAVCGN